MRGLSLLRGQRSIPDPPGIDTVTAPTVTDRTIEHGETVYRCRSVTRTDAPWNVAYGRDTINEDSRIFVFSGDELVYRRPSQRPIDARIAADGTVVVLEGGAPDGLNGRVIVCDPTGEERFSQEFTVNPRNCAISSGGDFAAVATRPPDVAVYLIDVGAQAMRATHEVEHGQVRVLGFTAGDILYIAKIGRDDPLFALDEDAEIAWKNERYRNTQPLSDRVRAWAKSIRR